LGSDAFDVKQRRADPVYHYETAFDALPEKALIHRFAACVAASNPVGKFPDLVLKILNARMYGYGHGFPFALVACS
jgi:hypothetical protein